MEVTASGLPRQRRNELRALVERLRGAWSGALTVGRTAAVVVDGSAAAAIDWEAPKLAVAALHGIPVVSSEWLEDSAQHGFLLAHAPYELAPPPPGRRSSAASTSLAGAGPPAAAQPSVAAAAQPAAGIAEHVPAAKQAVQQPHQQQQQQHQQQPQLQPGAATPSSPAWEEVEVERLREAQSPAPARQPHAFLERSPLGASPLAQAQQPAVAPAEVALQDLPQLERPSPASTPAAQRGDGLQLGGVSPSPLALLPEAGLPLLPGEPDDGGLPLLPSPLPAASNDLEGSMGGSAAGSERAGSGGRAAGTPSVRVGPAVAAVTPVGAAAMGGGTPARSSTDSDTVIARFLSRMPCVTVARGSALPAHMLHEPGSSPSRSCASTRSMPAGTPPSPEADSHSSGAAAGAVPGSAVTGREEQEAATATPAAFLQAAPDERGTPGQGSTPGSGELQPAPFSILRPWYTSSVMRMRRSLQGGRLPATTRVRLGPPLRRPPGQGTLEGLAERHGCGAEGGAPPRATLYESAEALPEDGPELRFTAGDTSHGAIMLYDILEDGRRVYALTLVQAIYRLEALGEAWMEHRYLLTRQDLAERPAWAAALQGQEVGEGEVLLSAGSYHSPLHLVTGQLWLRFPGRAQRRRRGRDRPAAAGEPAEQEQRQPEYVCRRGFDTAAGAVVPLRRALEGFAA